MLKIKYYESESKKRDGYHSCYAYIDTEDFDGYTMLDQMEPRCATYELAKEELLNHVKKLRDELNNLIERETLKAKCPKI